MFRFKQFAVWQDRCPMKVGTDGVLLGAWAEVRPGDRRMLDVGTGTGPDRPDAGPAECCPDYGGGYRCGVRDAGG